MGPHRITYVEIEAYARLHQIKIEGWQANLIRELSKEYILDQENKRRMSSPDKSGRRMRQLIPMNQEDTAQRLKDLFRNVGASASKHK